MKCPACSYNLTQKEVGGVVVDVCEGGCGGIWFDNFELKKFDEPHESEGEELVDIRRDPEVHVDLTAKRTCPVCEGMPMMQHFFSVKRNVAVDECPKCGGVWLDAGDLCDIRSLFNSEEDKKKAADAYFGDVFGKDLAAMKAESDEKLQKSRRFAKMFRWICPSNYIPGKQKWGAF